MRFARALHFCVALSALAGSALACQALLDFERLRPDANANADADVTDSQASNALVSDAGAGDADDADVVVIPPCPSVGRDDELVVDAVVGDDVTGDGKTKPYKSISKALSVINLAAINQSRTVCVRGGTTFNPNIYSESTTGEVFPLPLTTAGTVLRGEGPAVVRISFQGQADAGPNLPFDDGDFTLVVAIAVGAVERVAVRGFDLRMVAKVGIFNRAPDLAISDVTFTTIGNVFAQGARLFGGATLDRVVFTDNGESDCMAVWGAPVTLSDGVFEKCKNALQFEADGDVTARNVTFRGSTTAALCKGGKLTTKGCRFEGCGTGVALFGLTSPVTWSSTKDTFVKNNYAIHLGQETQYASSSFVDVTGATIKETQTNGLIVSSGTTVTVRDTSFLDGAGDAVLILPDARAGRINLGELDAGNVFQSVGRPNNGGICSTVAGTIVARGSGFRQCPPNATSACTSGGDVNDASIDTTGCYVAP